MSLNTGSIKVNGRSYNLAGCFAADNLDEANRFMAENRDTGVIAERNGWIYIAYLSDKGSPVATHDLSALREKITEEFRSGLDS